METKQTVGSKIAILRKARGLTQADIGALLNISYQAVSKWERDESCPDFETLSRLAQFFNVPISYFEKGGEEVATAAIKTVEQEEKRETQPTAERSVVNENMRFDVVLKNAGVNKVAVIKAVRDVTGLGFFEAKEVVDTNSVVKKNLLKTEADEIVAELQASGATATIVAYSQEREKQRQAERIEKCSKARNRGLIWGGIAASVAIVLGIFGGWKGALGMLAFDVFLFPFISQLFWDGAVLEVVECGGKVIGTPGIIFTFDLDGFIFLIAMKILFAVLRFLIYIITLLFFVAVAMLIAPFTFAPALLRVNKEGV